jgi:flagellar biosynthesis GTPase FlhF
MLRFLANWWAKVRYIWKEEFEAQVAELNAKAALSQAKDKRDLIAEVTKEADAIEENIKRVAAEDAAKGLTGKEQYEADQELKDAEKILQSKRDYAEKQLPEEIQKHEATANHFRRQAAQAREFADRLRRL